MAGSNERTDFIKVPVPEGLEQTKPTEPSRRIQSSDIQLLRCGPKDAECAAEGFYTAFPESAWDKMDPPDTRPDDYFAKRQQRMANRLRPTFKIPEMFWIKAVHVPTNEIVGMAGWQGPDLPAVHNVMRHSAFDLYNLKEMQQWTEGEFEDMWEGVSIETWDGKLGEDDEIRAKTMNGEKHWFLAPLFTLPKWQGRGVAKLLLKWAIDKADATSPPTPLFLESAATARAVYLHMGFKEIAGEEEVKRPRMVRRGPRVVD